MRKNIFIVVIGVSMMLCYSCKSDEKKSSSIKVLEQMIQSQTGEDVELPDNYSIENSSAKIDFTFDGKPFFKSNENFSSNTVIKSSNGFIEIHFQIYGEEGKALIVNIQKVPINFKLPLKVPFTNNPLTEDDFTQATMSAMDLASPEASMGFGIPYEGHIIIRKMENRLVSFEVDAKGGDFMSAETPNAWKPIQLKAELINPMIQTMGIEKSKIFK